MAITATIHFSDKHGFGIAGLNMITKAFADLNEAIRFTNDHGTAFSPRFKNFSIFYNEEGSADCRTYNTRMSF